jgi:dTDP-4-amino-4,6-dideoxygalactose transaminase
MTQTMRILPTDPKANYLAHRQEIDEAIRRVLLSGWYILGREVEAFEAQFATFLGARYAIGVGSGTDALEIALRACGVGAGDAVFTVSHTAVATVVAIERVGATAVLIDIDPDTCTMDPQQLARVLRTYRAGDTRSLQVKPKAIIPVHLYGHPCDMSAIKQTAHDYGLWVIEDCAQAHGATWNGQTTGNWGDAAAFSFYPTKNLGALGDGGMVVTSDANLAEKVRMLRQYGWRERYISASVGGNSRLDELQAAVLQVKLGHLGQENARRQKIAAIYDQTLAQRSLVLPVCRPEAVHVYHQYVVRTTERAALQAYLREHGVGTLVHYPRPVHLQPAYLGRLAGSEALPMSERAAEQVLSLPIYPELSDAETQYVAEVVCSWARCGNG